MKNLFKINIFTYLFFLLSILSGYFKSISIIYFILIIHELGHFIIMKHYKIKVYEINMYPYGGMIKSNILLNTNSKKVLLISLGGIIAQLILSIFFFILYKVNIINLNIYNIFYKYNIYIILFNLMPIYPLDGFKILNSILELLFNYKNSIILSFIINIIFLIFFIIYLYINTINNYIIVIFLLINLINYIKELKYIFNKFYLERIIYKLDTKGLVSVKTLDSIYKNKINYINGIHENIVISKKFEKYI